MEFTTNDGSCSPTLFRTTTIRKYPPHRAQLAKFSFRVRKVSSVFLTHITCLILRSYSVLLHVQAMTPKITKKSSKKMLIRCRESSILEDHRVKTCGVRHMTHCWLIQDSLMFLYVLYD